MAPLVAPIAAPVMAPLSLVVGGEEHQGRFVRVGRWRRTVASCCLPQGDGSALSGKWSASRNSWEIRHFVARARGGHVSSDRWRVKLTTECRSAYRSIGYRKQRRVR